MRTDFGKRVKLLEGRHHAYQESEQAAKSRMFFDRLSDEELNRFLQIAERTRDWELPTTPEELAFIDGLFDKWPQEARYGSV